jgi:DNA-binding PadR family transcriptional regulator
MVTRLNTTDEAVLQHVARYRMTLPHFLAHKHVLDVELGTAHELLDRLRKSGYLICCELTPEAPGTVCYQLTPKGAQRLGHSEEFARPLTREARIEHFAIQQFFCSGNEFRQVHALLAFGFFERAVRSNSRPTIRSCSVRTLHRSNRQPASTGSSIPP